jgi:hypothetical protein
LIHIEHERVTGPEPAVSGVNRLAARHRRR